MYWDILDTNRKNILPKLAKITNGFYLAGGTALALQLGHRDSIDFDFFSPKQFSNTKLFQKIENIFINHKILKTQDEKDTLSVTIDNNIKFSFITYKYKLIKPLINSKYFDIASIEDIGCMKLSAIVSRYLLKDYVDIYWILHQISLPNLIILNQQKHQNLDTNLVLKSLVYFDDIIPEPILYKNNKEISFDVLKQFLTQTVTSFSRV
ncbi:hypothetical protein CO009_01465 [Candidatus Shapirobacteria bacterium CG_4_8_14_3_um_filter_35_11]|uniref:Nucleotidyl transferase AbiEii/AbiGii toxin family protein n=6 Tax=Candidatus Shapironibacteriota TaxID=1752721 RepID=A0A1J5I4M9_9BACT|nr:MAG: hypothetical protein AUK05_01330 [Candidatus Shapirobacteria bacterium CG2_30_35_20]PIV07488.1 MAG: hypothetical protein COS53_01960 [Candidatus Shapirobacteria bacterium CG03_land_8_20_14_0_80_35_14]PIX68025.1 MAG: hypothetical protein COZ41_01935 [Candidatus Shapirobacteria bacterium CG_4_10_14_3_um_filter_35_13]PJA51124.1 MAG: hypothetical protein CO168_01450 [Candidatus Shapirobacteria bacterium CG_4_9_14_3_um_filter_36_12]PJC80640.1 MAG: hypothetical protein CO009_01465 [Candidatus